MNRGAQDFFWFWLYPKLDFNLGSKAPSTTRFWHLCISIHRWCNLKVTIVLYIQHHGVLHPAPWCNWISTQQHSIQMSIYFAKFFQEIVLSKIYFFAMVLSTINVYFALHYISIQFFFFRNNFTIFRLLLTSRELQETRHDNVI